PLPAARSVRGRHAGQHAHPQRHLGRHRASGHPFQHANLGPRRRGFPSRTMGRAWRKGRAGPGQRPLCIRAVPARAPGVHWQGVRHDHP
ncbi:hypothetical protein BN1723_020671, partial [Verticillium longisporum]